jgi:RND family efflux transporter MFP subunit
VSFACAAIVPWAFAQQPVAKVAVCTVNSGTLALSQEFNGNVFYKEVSNLATEISGKVVEVLFEEGDHLDKGTAMVRLDYVLLEAQLRAAQALVRQYETQLEQERVRMERARSLLKEEVTTPQEFDDMRFTVQTAEQRVEAAKADVERIEREIEKKTIRAPFSGRVIDRQTEVGDWKDSGDIIAIFARDDLYDVIVNVPEQFLAYIEPDSLADVTVAGKALTGHIITIIPRGDTVSRTFPVKVRIEGQPWLIEAMVAAVRLPTGQRTESLYVPLDAILLGQPENVVFKVESGRARRIPVEVVGNSGLSAYFRADGVSSGDQVIVKGHERLRDGDLVEVIQ